MWWHLVSATIVVGLAASETASWECLRYDEDQGQNDKWCQTVGVKHGIEYKWVGPGSDTCEDCWCCKRQAPPTTTETSTTETSTTETATTSSTATETSTTSSTVTQTETHTQTTTSTLTTTKTNTDTTTTKTDTTTSTLTQTTTTQTTTTQTATTTTLTTTTQTQTSTTITTTTTSTSTSTTGPHMFGGNLTKETFLGWLSVWRSKYKVGLWNAGVPDPWESLLPEALKGIKPQVVMSVGGVAGGIVTEGMGYGIMIEGFLAAKGDEYALQRGLALTKSWLGMVSGPGDLNMPLAGGANFTTSSTKASSWPYGVSAVEWSHLKLGAAGVPAWKFPIKKKELQSYVGSAADGDQDALLGMLYLAAALEFPKDFVDMVIRTLISFASADLGFPDLYRTLPDGTKIFVPKCGSMWGGLTPPEGDYKANQEPWCYSPGYFAPAHYRSFRDFAKAHWSPEFADYLPQHQDNTTTSLEELLEALDSAVTAGYNILYYSSCSSGTVSNWVGVEAPCETDDILNCAGVPWRHTPWVGSKAGTCQQSGTKFGSFGADASRTAWRLAMDYVLFREESAKVTLYDRDGREMSEEFGARKYLNRIVIQYKEHAICDGGSPGDCMKHTPSPFELAYAFDPEKGAPNLNCSGVPNPPESWWAGFMSYPTFSAFVAPYDEIGAEQMKNWMDTFSSICNFTFVNKFDYKAGGNPPKGNICLTSYFEASQAVIALLIMADNLVHLPKPTTAPRADGSKSTRKSVGSKPKKGGSNSTRKSGGSKPMNKSSSEHNHKQVDLITMLHDNDDSIPAEHRFEWHSQSAMTIAAAGVLSGVVVAIAGRSSARWPARRAYMQVEPVREDQVRALA